MTSTPAAIAGRGRPGAGVDAGTVVICCTACAGVAGEEIFTGVETGAGFPIVAVEADAVWFPAVPGCALIAYRENPVLVDVKVTCPWVVIP